MASLGERSATIYQFPQGGRRGLQARSDARGRDLGSRPVVVGLGEAWYHDEAIEAERAGREH